MHRGVAGLNYNPSLVNLSPYELAILRDMVAKQNDVNMKRDVCLDVYTLFNRI